MALEEAGVLLWVPKYIGRSDHLHLWAIRTKMALEVAGASLFLHASAATYCWNAMDFQIQAMNLI
jgi:hypothetical protein